MTRWQKMRCAAQRPTSPLFQSLQTLGKTADGGLTAGLGRSVGEFTQERLHSRDESHLEL